jgi:tetrahydromethanopterin S-methyltransferase subunit G
MATQQLPPQTPLEERLRQIEERLEKLNGTQVSSSVTSFLEKWLPGFSVIAIVGFAFWFGGFSGKIDANTAKVDKLMMWQDTATTRLGTIDNRLSVIETKLDNNQGKLDSIDKKLGESSNEQSRGGRR